MKYSGLIIFAIVIVLNLLGGIMKKRAEQQKQEKLARLSGSSSAKPAAMPQTKRNVLSNPAPSSRASQAIDRAEQLAARRKAQLDELRSRRAQRKTGIQPAQQPQPQARIGAGSSQTPAAFRSAPPQIPQAPSTRAKPQRVVIRPTTQPKKKAPVSRSIFTDHTEHERADTKRLHGRSSERLGASIARITAEPAKISPTMAILDASELTPEFLRRIVILKEIFDKPVALRDSEIWDRL